MERDGRQYDQLAIRCHVTQKLPDVHLESIGRTPLQELKPTLGFPLMVMEGAYYPQSSWPWVARQPSSQASRSDPLHGGVSIGTARAGSGTLGGIVRDRRTRQPMLLSNWHVIVGGWGNLHGQPIYQPSRDDGGTVADIVATLERDGMSFQLDAAVATLNKRRRWSNEQMGIPGPVPGVAVAGIGMQVEKSGRTSGITRGVVTGVGGIQRLQYAGIERVLRNVFTIEPRRASEEVSRGGDSGSWWLESTTKKAVGVHFAGSDQPERALALDMQSVLDALDVDVMTTL